MVKQWSQAVLSNINTYAHKHTEQANAYTHVQTHKKVQRKGVADADARTRIRIHTTL